MNTETMEQVRKIISDNPSRHSQGTWMGNVFGETCSFDHPMADLRRFAFEPVPAEPADDSRVCGTTGCVAMWSIIVAGDPGALVRDGYRIEVGPDLMPISYYAGQILGLSPGQADYLFSSSRTREEVLAALDWLPQHQDATWDELAEACGNQAGEYPESFYDDDED